VNKLLRRQLDRGNSVAVTKLRASTKFFPSANGAKIAGDLMKKALLATED
jgi:hypothetical protein